jgi:predicted TIM-barrel fold metal-dependent hydrolase
MIIDAHCHAALDGHPRHDRARLQAHLARASAAGIGRTVVFPVFVRDYRAANVRLADLVRRHPRELIGFAGVHARRDAGRLRDLVDHATDLGLRGLKVHGLEAPLDDRVCDIAARHGLPIVVDVVRRPEVVERLAPRHPTVRFVVAHLGGFVDDAQVFRRTVALAVREPNVFADLSAVRYWAELEHAARTVPEKLLFGSDGPFLHPGVELAKVRALALPAAMERRVLGETALALLEDPCFGAADRRAASMGPGLRDRSDRRSS